MYFDIPLFSNTSLEWAEITWLLLVTTQGQIMNYSDSCMKYMNLWLINDAGTWDQYVIIT